MNLFIAPPLKLCAAIGAGLLFLGCKAQSTNASQEPLEAAPAVTNVLTNSTAPVPPTNSVPEIQPAPEIKLSPELNDLIEMAERGVGDEVLIAFIENSPFTYTLTAEQILYLTDLGFSEAVIATMIKHGKGPSSLAQNTSTNSAAAIVPNGTSTVAPSPVGPPAPAAPVGNAPSVTITATPEFENGQQQPPPVTYVTPPPQVQYNYFYSSLDPYGSWIDVPDYGVCWQPTVAIVNPSWRPYSDRGRWLYTDCGWYWQSDYSWGWAPFHYGRWHRHARSGWVWLPDTTWGPAWVTWRHSDAYCGWAPLPPGARFERGFGLRYYGAGVGLSFDFGVRSDSYTFVHKNRFYDRTPWRHAIPPSHAANIYNNTTVVNNYVVGSNNTIVNEGIGRDHISRYTRSEIRKVAIRDASASDTRRHLKSERLEKDGTELAVFRPQFPAGDKPVNRAQEEMRKSFRAESKPQNADGSNSRINSRISASNVTTPPDPGSTGSRPPGRTIYPISRRTTSGEAVPVVTAPGAGSADSGRTARSFPLNSSKSVNPTIGSREVRMAEANAPQTPIAVQNRTGSQGPGGSSAVATVPPNRGVSESQPSKSIQEVRGTQNRQPQLIHTPVNPIQRERPQPIANLSTSAQPSQTPSAVNSAPPAVDPMRVVREQRRPAEATGRSLESRSYGPGTPQQPIGRSRGFERPAGFSPPDQAAQAPSTVIPPSRNDFGSAPTSRQELQKQITTTYPEKQGYGQPAPSYQRPSFSSPDLQPAPPRSAPSVPQYVPNAGPARQYSPPTIQTRPSASAPSAPPVQIQPRQVSPSMNATQPSAPSRSNGNGSGGRRQEASK